MNTRLRHWRLKEGLSVQELADLSGLSASMINRVERGERRLSFRKKVCVARVLGVRVGELFDVPAFREDPEKPSA